MAHHFITESDVKLWVDAAVKAALPPVMDETRSIFREAIKEHEAILSEVTRQHLEVMNEQGRAMNQVMSQMNKLIAVGGSTLLLIEFLKANKVTGSRNWTILIGAYCAGLFTLVRIL